MYMTFKGMLPKLYSIYFEDDATEDISMQIYEVSNWGVKPNSRLEHLKMTAWQSLTQFVLYVSLMSGNLHW